MVEGTEDRPGLLPCAGGHVLLREVQMHFEGNGWTVCLSDAAFNLGEGKCLYLERKEMSLLTLTWREGCVLAPIPMPLREDSAGMDFRGRRAVGRARDAT